MSNTEYRIERAPLLEVRPNEWKIDNDSRYPIIYIERGSEDNPLKIIKLLELSGYNSRFILQLMICIDLKPRVFNLTVDSYAEKSIEDVTGDPLTPKEKETTPILAKSLVATIPDEIYSKAKFSKPLDWLQQAWENSNSDIQY